MIRETRSEAVVANQKQRPTSAGRKITILNAGGDARVRSLTTHLLERAGWCVKEAGTGSDVLRLARERQPELILLDVNLPDPRGLEICRKLKRDRHTRSIPILQLHAASLSPEERQAALESDADAYLTHPVEPGLLAATVRAMLRARQTRDEERDTERVWRNAFDAMSHGFCLVDKSGKIRQVNRALCAIAGKSAEELAGRPHQLVYAGAPGPESGRLFERARKSRQHESEDILVGRRWFHVIVDPLFDDGGDFAGAVTILHDVTARHQLEDQLRRSQKMEAVGRLAGGVAHDFNNLLTIIAGYGQMLLDGLKPKDHPLRPDLEAIMEAAGRAAALTRQLLTLSRRQVVHPKVVDLNLQVARMSRMLHRVIGEDIVLATSLKANPSRIKIDPAQLEQVLLNLAVNARDAMPKGGKLTIRTASVAAGDEPAAALKVLKQQSILLSVTDTGTGMDAETLSHLFEPFYTTKAKGRGTGLGLSTVYGIVKQNGGEISIESSPGRGTAVRIYLPLAADAINVRVSPGRRHSAETGTETILLVEDEAEVRRLAREILTRQGYLVLEAASGPEALRLWQERSGAVDMILTDVVMPQMSGPKLVERLKALCPDVRVVYMSGYTDDVIARHGIISAETEFLQKPFTLDSLAAKVRSVLDQKDPG
jgi:PAS domain S-box-containing protein